MDDWADIEYRDFWDVPRIFFLTIGDRKLLADCPFDEAAEDYSSVYVVFEMPPDFEIPENSWAGIASRALTKLGEIPVAEADFDETKRRSVSTAAFRRFL